MCAPDMPTPPDPYETAGAQTGTNVSTAVANAFLNNVNQYTPYGSLTYGQSGTYKWTDPNSGAEYDIPQFTATQSMSPAYQAIFDTNTRTQQNLADIASNQSGFLKNYLSTGLDLSGLPAMNDFSGLPSYNVQTPTLGYGPTLNRGQNLNAGGAYGGNILSSFGATKTSIPTALPNAPDLNNLGTIQKEIKGVGPINASFSGGGGVQRAFGDAGPITKTYNTDFSVDRQRVEDAISSRLEPKIAADREALRAQLVGQGLDSGSTAYGDEQANFQRGVTDARMQTILAGGQEQSRLVGLEAARAAFENNAQNQNYAQLADRARFANEGSALDFQQAQARAMYELAAQGQQFGQLMGMANLNNQGIAQDFGQRMGAAQFGQQNYGLQLAANAQEYAQLLGRANFANDAQEQRWGQSRANIDASNAALQQMTQNDNYAAMTEYMNQLNAQQGNFDNALRGFTTNYSTSMSSAQAQNAARAQALQELFAVRNQPLNEINSLLGNTQLQSPNFVPTNMPQMPTVDIAGLINTNYQQRAQQAMMQYQQQQAMLGGMLGVGAAFAGNPAILSDRRTKKDIEKVGKAGGHNIYKFRYKAGGPVQFGVMAQEVEKKRPDAVATGPDGYKRVNYDALFDLQEAA